MKYAGKTIIGIAQERGSSAKTRAGAWKYLLAHLPGPAAPTCSHAYQHNIWLDNRWHHRAAGRAIILGYSLDDPNTPGRAASRQAELDREIERDRSLCVRRNEYGALLLAHAERSEQPRPEIAAYRAATQLLARAVAAGSIPQAYDGIEWDRQRRADGTALHHDLYDVAQQSAIVCIRRTEGSRYGVATKSKSYLLITESDEHEIAAADLSAPIAKYAKLPATSLGAIIAHVRGEKKLSLGHPPVVGYKAVALEADGTYRSVWDQSEWALGLTRVERVAPEHGGGYYYYRDLATLLAAARDNQIFGAARNHRRLAILAIRAEGRHIEYSSGKYAASRITVLEQIGSII